jgi:hypothetical protein
MATPCEGLDQAAKQHTAHNYEETVPNGRKDESISKDKAPTTGTIYESE